LIFALKNQKLLFGSFVYSLFQFMKVVALYKVHTGMSSGRLSKEF